MIIPISHGGNDTPNSDTKFVVSWWHIPGGCQYDHAMALEAFFPDQVSADSFCREVGTMPPEMAIVIPYETYLKYQGRKHGRH